MMDMSREQAVRWVAREVSKLEAYDEIYERIGTERLIMEKNSGPVSERYPMTACARMNLIARLEKRLETLRKRLH